MHWTALLPNCLDFWIVTSGKKNLALIVPSSFLLDSVLCLVRYLVEV